MSWLREAYTEVNVLIKGSGSVRRASLSKSDRFKRILTQAFAENRLRRCLLFAVLPAIAIYVIVIALMMASGFNLMQAVRDPAQQTETSSWLGLVSNLGVLSTTAAAVICFFTVSLEPVGASKQRLNCLLLAGIFSALLAVDDFFLLHDRYIDQTTCYVAYAVCLVLLLTRHYKTIVKVEAPAFLVAGVLLALSIFTDAAQFVLPLPYQYSQAFEEGFKFSGMVTWLYFNYRLARSALSNADRALGAPTGSKSLN